MIVEAVLGLHIECSDFLLDGFDLHVPRDQAAVEIRARPCVCLNFSRYHVFWNHFRAVITFFGIIFMKEPL